MASPSFMYIPGTFYKIADGPLDIRTQQIQVLVNGSTNPETIMPGRWDDISTVDSGSVISGSLYLVEISTGYMASECIFVCDNAVLNDYAMNFGGEMPFTGIFVSEGIESIIIPEGEEVHTIDNKYLGNGVAPALIGETYYHGHTLPYYGFEVYKILSDSQGEEISIQLTNGDEIIDVASSTVLFYTGSNLNKAGYIETDSETGAVMLYPGLEEGRAVEVLSVLAAKDPTDASTAYIINELVSIETIGQESPK